MKTDTSANVIAYRSFEKPFIIYRRFQFGILNYVDKLNTLYSAQLARNQFNANIFHNKVNKDKHLLDLMINIYSESINAIHKETVI